MYIVTICVISRNVHICTSVTFIISISFKQTETDLSRSHAKSVLFLKSYCSLKRLFLYSNLFIYHRTWKLIPLKNICWTVACICLQFSNSEIALYLLYLHTSYWAWNRKLIKRLGRHAQMNINCKTWSFIIFWNVY